MAKFAACTCNPLEVSCSIPSPFHNFPYPRHKPSILQYPFSYFPKTFYMCHSKKKNSKLEPVPKPTLTEEVADEEEEEDDDGEFGDEFDEDGDDFFEDEYDDEEIELSVGDGAGGGGISLAGTSWDQKALSMAEDTLLQFNGDLKIYAFRTLAHGNVRIRIEKLTNKSGSPDMSDIQDFATAYRAQLDEAEKAGTVPNNISMEVSSPGLERVVQIPQDLDRFKNRPMYVKYVSESTETGLLTESDGVFRLDSFDLVSGCCTWGLADVKINRAKAGKGRPLNEKQREWCMNTPFHSLLLVRLHADI